MLSSIKSGPNYKLTLQKRISVLCKHSLLGIWMTRKQFLRKHPGSASQRLPHPNSLRAMGISLIFFSFSFLLRWSWLLVCFFGFKT